MLRFQYRIRPRRMASVEGLGSGPEGRLKRLRKIVSSLIRNERLEMTYERCDEARGYAERLIHMALRNGDRDRHTMEMADYWLLEKDLIHKLFKVLVPRYQGWQTSFTSVYTLPTRYPGDGRSVGILELKGNPYPPVITKQRDTRYFLSNLLLNELKKDKTMFSQQTENGQQFKTSGHLDTSRSSPVQNSTKPPVDQRKDNDADDQH